MSTDIPEVWQRSSYLLSEVFSRHWTFHSLGAPDKTTMAVSSPVEVAQRCEADSSGSSSQSSSPLRLPVYRPSLHEAFSSPHHSGHCNNPLTPPSTVLGLLDIAVAEVPEDDESFLTPEDRRLGSYRRGSSCSPIRLVEIPTSTLSDATATLPSPLLPYLSHDGVGEDNMMTGTPPCRFQATSFHWPATSRSSYSTGNLAEDREDGEFERRKVSSASKIHLCRLTSGSSSTVQLHTTREPLFRADKDASLIATGATDCQIVSENLSVEDSRDDPLDPASDQCSFISGLETEGTATSSSTTAIVLSSDGRGKVNKGRQQQHPLGHRDKDAAVPLTSPSFSEDEPLASKQSTSHEEHSDKCCCDYARTEKYKHRYVLFNPYKLPLSIRLWLELTAAPFLILWVYLVYFAVLVVLTAPHARQIVWLNAVVAGMLVGIGLNANAYRAIMYQGSPDYGMIIRFFLIPFGVSAMSGLINSMREHFMLVFPKEIYHLMLAVATPAGVVLLLLFSRVLCLWRHRVPITIRNFALNGKIYE